jgi:hypothetical protein
MNILRHPLSKDYGQEYPIIQYADDTLIVMPAYDFQLLTLKCILRSFADSTDIKVNYSKSFLVPINIEGERALHLTNTIGCQVVEMPFYLPWFTSRNHKAHSG